MTEHQAVAEIVGFIQSGWSQLTAIGALIVWGRTIDLRVKEHIKRLDRHEARLTAFESAQQKQDVRLARIEEGLSSIKITLDRTYSQVSELGRIQHWNDKTHPPR